MTKELPYFKFFPDRWLTGDISLMEPYDQGIFINLCCYYWKRHCEVSLAKAKQKFSNCLNGIENLLKNDIIKINENENLIIEFLDEQYAKFSGISAKRSAIGKSGGQAKAKQKPSKRKAKAKQLVIYKEKEYKEIYKEKISFYEEQKQFCLANGNDQGYLNLVDYLFGKNELKRPIYHVLDLECQLQYIEYLEIKKKAKDYDKTVKDYLNIIVDTPKYAKGKTSLYLCLCKYIANDKKKRA